MKNEFMNYCRELNNKCIEAQAGNKEVVSEETAVKAIYIIKNMEINSLEDVLLYGAALNVLNTYVKQDNGDRPYIGYFFKGYANTLAQYLVDHCEEGMDLELQTDRGMTLLVVDLYGIQCSFHCVKLKGNLEHIKASATGVVRIGWDGVRKQRCANTFFEGALNIVCCQHTAANSVWNLITAMNGVVSRYRNGLISIKQVG